MENGKDQKMVELKIGPKLKIEKVRENWKMHKIENWGEKNRKIKQKFKIEKKKKAKN